MIPLWLILLISLGYFALLFGIAYYGDKRQAMGKSIINNSITYALSLAVYCTAWTFYGSVGRAATDGVGFLPVYLGPVLTAPLWYILLRKIVRISKIQRITSIADFLSARYGKSAFLGGLVTLIAVVSIIPYISLQLKAISSSLDIVLGNQFSNISDSAFFVAAILAIFSILFGTRNIDATEQNEGLVAAIAFESVFKLLAFIAIGVFTTFMIYDSPTQLFAEASQTQAYKDLFVWNNNGTNSYWDWTVMILLSACAFVLLPRQFQVAVVENVDEKHIEKAIWLFPLYLFFINIFVLPIAIGGLMYFEGSNVDADTFVLTLPLAERQFFLTIIVFLGGLSAATSMVIVATVALSNMISSNLVMPILLNSSTINLREKRYFTRFILYVRRASIVFVMIWAYIYFEIIGYQYSLVSIGLISFVGVTQFAPAVIGALFWKRATKIGAISGLMIGFAVWTYTLPFPTLIEGGFFSSNMVSEGLWGIELLKPYQLFGLKGMNQITHACFWSLFFNIGIYVGVSLFTLPSSAELSQASAFVDVFKYHKPDSNTNIWRGKAYYYEIKQLLNPFLGKNRTANILEEYALQNEIHYKDADEVSPEMVSYIEKILAGAIGTASAKVVISTVLKEEIFSLTEVMQILDETQQIILHSKEIEQKSKELEEVTAELKAANERLKEFDKLKDDFISTVTHELRTPLTSIKAFSEILFDNAHIKAGKRQQFLGIIVKESERLTRLINEVLDFQRLEMGKMKWNIQKIAIQEVIQNAVNTTKQMASSKGIELKTAMPEEILYIQADGDKIMQVLLNLISNAVKFRADKNPYIHLQLKPFNKHIEVSVADNGRGIPIKEQALIFDQFKQVHTQHIGNKPHGSGLGLAISKKIVEHHGGKIWVESIEGMGSVFYFRLPIEG
ncbi:MAG: sensor histidine kinase [Chitinophagales bacterium]